MQGKKAKNNLIPFKNFPVSDEKQNFHVYISFVSSFLSFHSSHPRKKPNFMQ